MALPLHLDASKYQFEAAALEARPVVRYTVKDGQRVRTDEQDTNPAGVPLWQVELAAYMPTGIERIRVKVANKDALTFTPRQPVQLTGLTAVVGDDRQVFYAASGITVPQAARREV